VGVLGNSTLDRRVALEVLFKHIESELTMELKSILESALSSLGSRSTPREVLEFTVKLAASNTGASERLTWRSGSPCSMIFGRYEPDTREMIIYVDKAPEEYGYTSITAVEATLWYLLVRHLQHTMPNFALSGFVLDSMDKDTAMEVEACILSTILSNLDYHSLDAVSHIRGLGRALPIIELFSKKPPGRAGGAPFSSVRSLVNYLVGEIERLRYFTAKKPVAKRLVNDSRVEWSIFIEKLSLSRRMVVLESLGGRIAIYYMGPLGRGFFIDYVEGVLEEPIELNIGELEEVVFHPEKVEPYIEFITRSGVKRVKAYVKWGEEDKPLVFNSLGEALAELSKAKIPVELSKPECRHLGEWSALVYKLPRILDLREPGVYHLAEIKLMLKPETCLEYNKAYSGQSRGFK
jgi:hypothetical protein